jgi:hypothetical protein
MVVDFSKIRANEPPLLILCDVDGTRIQPLTYAFNAEAALNFNELSTVKFDYPAWADGARTPRYEKLVGFQIIEWPDVGYFTLVQPETVGDGIKEIKTCEAQSIEYEFTRKNISFENRTYNFWNPAAPDNTVIGRILERMPGWAVGSIDKNLWNRYRTFEEDGSNIYDFMKGTCQQTFSCIIDFDTLHRRINAVSTASFVPTKQVYLSFDNLVKEINITENTEDITTCIEPTGADGVDIRSANPLGGNVLYDYSYYLTEANVGKELADKWSSWKKDFTKARTSYFRMSVQHAILIARNETAKAKLADLNGELSALETLQSVDVDASAQGVTPNKPLSEHAAGIRKQKQLIAAQEAEIASIESEISSLVTQMRAVNSSLQFENYKTADGQQFSKTDRIVMDRYTKEFSMSDSSFVVPVVESYNTVDASTSFTFGSLSLSASEVTCVEHAETTEAYSAIGGKVVCTVSGKALNADVVRLIVEYNSADKSIVLTGYVASGDYNGTAYDNGCITLTGHASKLTTDVQLDAETGAYSVGESLDIVFDDGHFYLTKNNSDFDQRTVEWDLFDYAVELLDRMSKPTYTFSISPCDFFAADGFDIFRKQLELGKRIYLNLGDDMILEPICTGAQFDFEDPTNFELLFDDTFTAGKLSPSPSQILRESVSAGKQLDASKYTSSAFVNEGASSALRNLYTNALDASRNAILSSQNQDIRIDQTGVRLRESDGSGGFKNEQIWMTKNNIVFTRDNWESAEMAIGKIIDPNFITPSNPTGELWGICAPALIGKILAGESLMIEAISKDGKAVLFRVDGDGAKLYNANFDLVSQYTYNGVTNVGQIGLHPTLGITAGNDVKENGIFEYNENGDIIGVKTTKGSSVQYIDELVGTDRPKAKFWVDMKGNVYLEGKVYATSGEFSGTLKATKLEGELVGANGGAIKGVSLGIGGRNYDNFMVDSNGNVTMQGNINLSGGTITWGDNLPEYDSYTDQDAENLLGRAYAITTTKLGCASIESPEITGNNIKATRAFKVGLSDGYMGRAKGRAIVDDGWGPTTMTTFGVAMASGGTLDDGTITFNSDGNYVIATDGGARLTSNSSGSRSDVTTTSNSATMSYNDKSMIRVDSSGCHYTTDGKNWKDVGSGGNVVAVWGS